MKYDLHVHTKLSDGKYSKLYLLQRANELNFQYISFADHNIFDDYSDELEKEYIRKYNEMQKVKVINATELDIVDISQFHLLVYDIKRVRELLDYIMQINYENNNITEEIVKKIYQHYGIKIPLSELFQLSSNGFINKKHIVMWILEHKYASTWNEAGYLYTSKYSPCYVKKADLKLETAILMVQAGGGLSVFAHPSSINYNNENLDSLVRKMSQMGLDGIEIINTSKTSIEQSEYYEYLARKYNLYTTCGSDFHSIESGHSLGIENDKSSEFIKCIEERRR